MTHHSFIDESIRGNNFYLAEIQIATKDVGWIRTSVSRKMRRNGSLVHMHNESMASRNRAIEELMKLPFQAKIIQCHKTISILKSRERCVHRLASSQHIKFCKHLVFEQISSNLADRRILEMYAKKSDSDFPEFRHMKPSEEPLLIIPDVVAWSFGRGGIWRQKIASKIIEFSQING